MPKGSKTRTKSGFKLDLTKSAVGNTKSAHHDKELKDAFEQFDADKSGLITIEETSILFKNFGFNLKYGQLLDIFQDCDVNGDGEIDFEEFKTMIQNIENGKYQILQDQIKQGVQAQQSKSSSSLNEKEKKEFKKAITYTIEPNDQSKYDIFQQLDTSNTGRLFIPELRKQLEQLDMAITMRQADHIIDQIDEDKDGYIDFREFKLFLAIMNGETVHKEIDMRHQLIESVPISLAKNQQNIEKMKIPQSEIDMFFGPVLTDQLVDHVQEYVEQKNAQIMGENKSLKKENKNLKEQLKQLKKENEKLKSNQAPKNVVKPKAKQAPKEVQKQVEAPKVESPQVLKSGYVPLQKHQSFEEFSRPQTRYKSFNQYRPSSQYQPPSPSSQYQPPSTLIPTQRTSYPIINGTSNGTDYLNNFNFTPGQYQPNSGLLQQNGNSLNNQKTFIEAPAQMKEYQDYSKPGFGQSPLYNPSSFARDGYNQGSFWHQAQN